MYIAVFFQIKYNMQKLLKNVSATALLSVIVIFIIFSDTFMSAFFDGITVWALNVLPALFPFSVLSALMLNNISASKKFSLTQLIFGIKNADLVFLASIMCGYPIGAKTICNCCGTQQSLQATQLCTFCNTASPVFVLATVARFANSTKVAWIILLSHWFSAIICGILFRGSFTKEPLHVNHTTDKTFAEIISDSTLSVLTVGGIIALFFMFCSVLCKLPFAQNTAVKFLFGLVEMTSGVIALCNVGNPIAVCVLCSAIISFGGICVALQSLNFLQQCGVKPKHYYIIKTVQASVATITSYVFCIFVL